MFATTRLARKALLPLVLGFTLVAAACGPVALPGAGASGPRIDPAQPVQVALLVPASDPQGGAILAKSAENAARLAAADLQGAQLNIRVYDTAGTEAGAAAAAAKAQSEGAQIVVGPIYSQTTNAARAQLAGSNLNILSLSNNSSVAGGNVFILGNSFENTARRLVNYAAAQGKRRIFVMHGNDVAELQGRDAIVGAVRNSSASLAGTGGFELSQQGVTSAVPQLARQAQAANADAVFLTSGTAGALPFLVDLLPENGLTPEVAQFIGLQRLDIPASALSLRGLQGSWFALPDTSLVNRFNARYRAAYGSDPHPIVSGPAYDAVAAIGALVAQGDAGAVSASSLTRGQGFVGAGGVFRLRADGTNDRALAVAQIQNNQVVVIDPAPRSFGGAGF
jgi:hypothetical protein